MFNRIRAYVSASPLAHVVIAAFVGGVAAVLEPTVQSGASVSFPILKVALYAGISAAVRALVLLVPGKPAA